MENNMVVPLKQLALVLVLLAAMFLPLFLTSPVVADVRTDSITVTLANPFGGIYAYKDLITAGDNLFIAYLTVTVNETTANPTPSIGNVILASMWNSTGLITQTVNMVQPFGYVNNGYNYPGVIAVYLSPGSTTSNNVTWNDPTTYMKLAANPTAGFTGTGLPWNSTVPTWDTNADLPGVVLSIATSLQSNWGASFTIINASGTNVYLGTMGVIYFTTVIPNLMTIAPTVFSISSIPVPYQGESSSYSYQSQLQSGWDPSYYTDMANLASTFHIPGTAKGMMLFFGLAMSLAAGIMSVQAHKSTKPFIPISGGVLIALSLFGLPPVVAVTVFCSGCVLFIVWFALYKQTN